MTNEAQKYYRIVDEAGDPNHLFDQYLLPYQVHEELSLKYRLTATREMNLVDIRGIDLTKPAVTRLVADKPTHVLGLPGRGPENYEDEESHLASKGLGSPITINIPKSERFFNEDGDVSILEFVRNLAITLSQTISE